MTSNNLDNECSKLKDLLVDTIGSKDANLWNICYQWWNVYRTINDQIKSSKEFSERNQIIENFALFQKELSAEMMAGYKELGIDVDKVQPLDDNFDNYPKHMMDIILVMRLQRKKFMENLKSIKAEKEGRGTDFSRKLAKRKRNWIKS